jgi:deoxyribonuclease-4
VTGKTPSAPLLGAHLSIAGGCHRAVLEAAALGCTALQIFTKNSNQWRERTILAEEAELFARSLAESGVRRVVSHAGYLINLAAGDEDLRRRSAIALTAEIRRCAALGIGAVVVHPGSHGGDGEEEGLERAVRSLDEVVNVTAGVGVTILLENTAGQGNSIGHAFAHLGRLIGGVRVRGRLGVCLDTCHAFAAGYDISAARGWRATLDELDREAGLALLGAVHVNDSKKGLGSRVDRHEHIGRGAIGVEGFRLVMTDPGLAGVPKILETPKETDGRPMDPVNLALLRSLAG